MLRHFLVLLTWTLLLMPVAQASPAPSPFTVAAVVNDHAITHYDIRERIKFIIATTGLKPGEDTIRKLYPRVINTLVDEQLQLQEAERYSLSVSRQEIADALGRIEQERRQPPGSLATFLEQQNINQDTMEAQLRSQIAWSKVLQQRIVPKIRMSDAEVARELLRAKKRERQVEEAKLVSLLLPFTNEENPKEAEALALQIVEDLRGGANFSSIAKQLSGNQLDITAPQWLPLHKLEPEMASLVRDASPPAILGPVRLSIGFQIISVSDKRTANYSTSAEVLFKEIILSLDYDAGDEELDLLMTIARQVRKNPGSCKEKDVAGATDLDGLAFNVDYTRTMLSDISPEILPLVRGLSVGQTSEPFATPEGIRMLTLCERVDLPPSEEQKKQFTLRLKEEKFRLEAVRYLRDLRRNAFVDIRV